MESTRRLDIVLPEDLADAVEARVSAGEYSSISEVVEDGLRALAERSDSTLSVADRDELAAAYDAWKAKRTDVITLSDMQRRLAEARHARG